MVGEIDFGAALREEAPRKGKGRKAATEEVAKADPFDLAPIRARFVQYDGKIHAMAHAAEAFVVADEDTVRAAVEMAGQSHTMAKAIEDQRKAIVEEPNRFVKAVNNFCKDYTGRFEQISSVLKKKITDYQYKKEMIRREAERKAREEDRRLQEALNKEAQEKGIQAPEVLAQVLPKPETTTRTEDGSAYLKKTWAFEVVDAGAVPRDYCEPSDRLIRQAVTGGIREIPGVRIFEKVQTVIRS